MSKRICPSCGWLVDDQTGMDDPDAIPKAGDVLICLSCSAPLVYLARDAVRAATDAEIVEFMQHDDFRKALKVAELTRQALMRKYPDKFKR